MDINAERWPEMFLKFGPYAVLALFVIWVIPHTSKRLRDLPERAPSKSSHLRRPESNGGDTLLAWAGTPAPTIRTTFISSPRSWIRPTAW